MEILNIIFKFLIVSIVFGLIYCFALSSVPKLPKILAK